MGSVVWGLAVLDLFPMGRGLNSANGTASLVQELDLSSSTGLAAARLRKGRVKLMCNVMGIGGSNIRMKGAEGE